MCSHGRVAWLALEQAETEQDLFRLVPQLAREVTSLFLRSADVPAPERVQSFAPGAQLLDEIHFHESLTTVRWLPWFARTTGSPITLRVCSEERASLESDEPINESASLTPIAFRERRMERGRDCSLPRWKLLAQAPVRMGNGKAFFQADEPEMGSFARIR